jgi:hypothetical protein
MDTPDDTATGSQKARHTRTRLAVRAAAVVAARVRFLLLLFALLGLIAAWPLLQNYWGKLTRGAPTAGAVSPDTEYWCPMCPGVVSDWPSKCPVCNMTLVRRQKGDMTPLPDGAVPRVQLSPYRIQLAGIRTSPVDYVRLEYEVAAAGVLEGSSGSNIASGLTLTADVFERDAAMLAPGQEGAVSCDACPGEFATARVAEIVPAAVPAAGRRVRVRVENPPPELRPGLLAVATFRTAASGLDSSRRYELIRWRDRVAVGLALHSFGRLDGPSLDAALPALLDAGVRAAAARQGHALAVPESAVIDTGARQVVYRESMPGMFDAVEVRLGRRCGDFYPVLAGLEFGQRVATAGAVLLDAETRHNPNLAATYFGSGSRTNALPQPAPAPPTSPSPADDRQLIAKQKVCPVTGEDLESMGGPVKVVIDGRAVFVCCKSCEKPLRGKPEKYLPKLPK